MRHEDLTKDLEYRADIDGLRALAVMSVILFHVGIAGFDGGFVGVDIFFVISGYLITAIIKTQIENNSFSFRTFYMRRARRLLPALTVTLYFSFIAGAFLISPKHFEQMNGSLFYGLFSLSNFFFLGEVGYFDTAAQFKPLLHTWSLAVEEQFYIFFPVTIFILYKVKHRLLKLFLIIGLVFGVLLSLGLAVLFEESKSAFYFTPFRLYEFFIGIILVFLPRAETIFSNIIREIIFTSGFIIAAGSIILFDASLPFPSAIALVPTLGAGMMIYANAPKFTGCVLNNRLFIGIGKISYSLYLVHWPIFVYLNYSSLGTATSLAAVVLIASFAAAIGMYYAIEQPFRAQKDHFLYKNFSRIIPAAYILLGVLSFHAWQNYGWEFRFSKDLVERINQDINEDSQLSDAYYEVQNIVPADISGNTGKNIFIVGDSHSRDVYNALATQRDDALTGYNIYHLYLDEKCFARKNYTPSLARKILGVEQKDNSDECTQNKKKVEELLFAKQADYVIIATAISEDQSDDELDRMPEMIAFHRQNSPKAKLIIFGVNRLPFDPPTFYLLRSGKDPSSVNMQMYQLNRSVTLRINDAARKAASAEGAAFFDFYPLLCPADDEICHVVDDDGRLLFSDDNHWTFTGEKFFGKMMTERSILQ